MIGKKVIIRADRAGVFYNRFTGWCHWKKEKIIAWCKLSDIEPYKEETK